jgi:hypothetical protein
MEAVLDEVDQMARPKPKAPSVPRAARFLPVRIVEDATGLEPSHEPLGLSPSIQVLLGSGLRVAVGPGFDPDVLRRVIVTLESP